MSICTPERLIPCKSEFTAVFRGWEKRVWTKLEKCSRSLTRFFGRRQTSRESTFGLGQNTFGPTWRSSDVSYALAVITESAP